MGIFNMFRSPDINTGLQQFKTTNGAVLIDVREADEYAEGHIGGSINIPLSRLVDIKNIIDDKKTPLFLHCLSGARSARATATLVNMGYTSVTNIGGISNYEGKVER